MQRFLEKSLHMHWPEIWTCLWLASTSLTLEDVTMPLAASTGGDLPKASNVLAWIILAPLPEFKAVLSTGGFLSIGLNRHVQHYLPVARCLLRPKSHATLHVRPAFLVDPGRDVEST